MKTQIIQLEPHDDWISTRDKIGWGQTSLVILVWPQKGRILSRPLDLVLLQRHSQHLGAYLVLSTRDRLVQQEARQLGLPVFSSLRQAQNTLAQRTGLRAARRVVRHKPQRGSIDHSRSGLIALRETVHPPTPIWLAHPLVRLGIFSLTILVIITLIAALAPSARITLEPRLTTQEITLSVAATSDISAPLLSGQLPLQTTTIVVEGRSSIPATGTIQVPEKHAIGTVRFTNLTNRAVTIPEDTVVTTLNSPVARFITLQSANLPARIGSQVSLPVQAVIPGPESNLPAGSIQAIEGNLGLLLNVTNPQPTRLGSSRSAPGVTRADQQKLLDQLTQSLKKTAAQELIAALPSDFAPADFPLIRTLALKQILEESYKPDIGQPAEEATLVLRLEFEVQRVSQDDLRRFAEPVLALNLPKDFRAIPASLKIQHQTEPDENLTWKITLKQDIESIILPEQAVATARGLPTDLAPVRIANLFDLQSPPTIQLTPDWWPYVPFLPFRIAVHFRSGAR